MCVLAFAWNADPRWPLILIGNRDERHDRPAEPLARWEGDRHVMAGRDVAAGGSWLGVSEEGRLAVVTNVRSSAGPDPDKASRGRLVADLLTGGGRYADPAAGDLGDFNPFNLIEVGGHKARLLTNRPAGAIHTVDPGIHGMSNGALDESWPKVDRIKALVEDWIGRGGDEAPSLLDALRTDAAPLDRPEDAPGGPLFILNRVYGTRCSTAVIVDAQGHGVITERRYDAAGVEKGETAIGFDWTHTNPRSS